MSGFVALGFVSSVSSCDSGVTRNSFWGKNLTEDYIFTSWRLVTLVVLSLKTHLHDTTCCQASCQTSLTTGSIVYTNIQPVVQPV